MNSLTQPLFWKAYEKLDNAIKNRSRKAFALWKENPFHPSLHFKCVNAVENVWSLRISRGYRALCIFEDDKAVWFWIGDHNEYERLIKKKK